MRSIDWVDGQIVLIDQTRLPREERQLRVTTVDELVDAISRLAVRGAPALGAAGALGVLLAVHEAARSGWDEAALLAAVERVRSARPTAVNLARGVDRVAARLAEGAAAVEDEALRVLTEDGKANRAIGQSGARLLLDLVGTDRLRLYTHCNAGALATVEWGTALGIVHSLFDLDRLGLVYVGETRPLLQGSRLTAWELQRLGVDYRVVVDGAGAGVIARGHGRRGGGRGRSGGRQRRRGEQGGHLPAGAGRHPRGHSFRRGRAGVHSGRETPSGDAVNIELRSQDEVLAVGGVRIAPDGARGLNPAFDITPADLVTALVTEHRIVRPATGERPA